MRKGQTTDVESDLVNLIQCTKTCESCFRSGHYLGSTNRSLLKVCIQCGCIMNPLCIDLYNPGLVYSLIYNHNRFFVFNFARR